MLPMNELAVFTAVVEAGNLSAAARALGVSKAAVSDQLRRLEERLGARLLNRTTRRVSLTEAGAACYRHSRRMVESADAAARSATLLHDEPRGTLRIAAPTTFAPLYIVPALATFRARYPQLSIELAVAAGITDIIADRFDVAIRIGELPDSRLVARRLASYRLLICGSPDYCRRRGMPSTVSELGEHDTLEFTPLGWRGTWRLVGPNRNRKRLRITPVVATDDGDALLAAAIAGIGLAALPDWLAVSALKQGRLIRVLPGWGGKWVPVQAVYPSARQTPAKTRLFVDHIAHCLAEANWREARDALA